MTGGMLALIFLSVSLSALAQLALRHGMASQSIQSILHNSESNLQLAWTIATNPYVFGGLFMYGIGAISWLFVLSKLEVSTAYPFVGLGFILTMILGFFLLQESISTLKVLGTMLVTIGVVMVSKS